MKRALIWIPAGVFAASFMRLAAFHGTVSLWGHIVHEDGLHTFGETLFFLPHFLGHVPVLVTIALLFAGSWRSISPGPAPARSFAVGFGLCSSLALCAVLSIVYFGFEATWENVMQLRQSAARAGEGGSWGLHLPSTMMLFLGVPLYVLAARLAFGRPVAANSRGVPFLAAAALLAASMTFLVGETAGLMLSRAWSDPRYLAHSVRELATFPLTLFPPALYLLFREEGEPDGPGTGQRQAIKWLAVGAALFGFLLAYQVYVPLSAGLGGLSQRPAFAGNQGLPVSYLLAFHYFEHFLDMLWFAPLCLYGVSSFSRQDRMVVMQAR